MIYNMQVQLPPVQGTMDDDRLSYRYVTVPELRSVWPALQYGLEMVRTSNGEPWIVEDVYAALLHGRAHLYIFEDADGEIEGFGIFEVIHFPSEFKPRLNVWIGWSKHPAQGWMGVALAKEIARVAGIESIVFATTQESSWTKKFKKLHTWYEV